MIDFKQLSDADLIELLATYTAKYTQLFKLKAFGKDYEECKRMVDNLVIEACKRKSQTDTHSLENFTAD